MHPTLASLPDECLLAVLALVPSPERLATCALVCKRWLNLVTADPQLLRSLELSFRNVSWDCTEPPAQCERRLHALLRFLCSAAPHVRQLDLFVENPKHYDWPQARQLAAEPQACLGRCGSLASLSLSLSGMPCTLGPWLAPLAGSLRHLRAKNAEQFGGQLELLSGGLAACTRLETLTLECKLLARSAACWPSSITSLNFETQYESQMPETMSALTSLRHLRVAKPGGYPKIWAPLATLTALTGLELDTCEYLPEPRVWSCLQRLQALNLVCAPERFRESSGMGSDSEEETEAFHQEQLQELEPALEALGALQLTHLKLRNLIFLDHLPHSLSCLTSLRSFEFTLYQFREADARVLAMPPAGWSGNLRQLQLPHAFLAVPSVLRSLDAATRLEYLRVDRLRLPPHGPLPNALRFVSWAAGRPHMKQLTVGLEANWRPHESDEEEEEEEEEGRRRRRCNAPRQSALPEVLDARALATVSSLTVAALQAQACRPGMAIMIAPAVELR